jgi:hypothetical protein
LRLIAPAGSLRHECGVARRSTVSTQTDLPLLRRGLRRAWVEAKQHVAARDAAGVEPQVRGLGEPKRDGVVLARVATHHHLVAP